MTTHILALDVDGTLIRGDRSLPSNIVEQLTRVVAEGWELVLATGRQYSGIQKLLEQLPNCCAITSDGSTVYRNKKVVRKQRIDTSAWLQLAKYGYELGLTPILCNESFAICEGLNTDTEHAVNHGLANLRLAQFDDSELMEVSLLLLVAEDENIVTQGVAALSGNHHFHVAISAPGFVSVMPRGVTKGDALLWLTDEEFGGRNQCFIVAAGDSHNDREMLLIADHSIAMESAPRELQLLANQIAPTLDSGGLSDFLHSL